MRNIPFLFSILIFLSGCSIERLAVRSTIGFIENSLISIEEETDLILAEQSIASNLKLLEGLIKSDPRNRKLLILAARGYTSYALGFVEETDPERAVHLYMRARDYGIRGLNLDRDFNRLLTLPFEDFEREVAGIPDRDIPFLFWTANAWAGAIQLAFGDPVLLASLPRVEEMMRVVLKRDESYYYAGPHIFFGMLLSSKPVLFGGNPPMGKEHFERALELTSGKYLIIHVFYAQTYAVQTLDKELYNRLLAAVLEMPIDSMPDQKLVNTIAKKRAERLLERTDEFF
jgi:hypothetical protein